MLRTRFIASLSVLCFIGCEGAVRTSPNSPQGASSATGSTSVVAEVTPAQMEVSPESASDLKATGQALFNGIKASSVTQILATFPSIEEVQKWAETLKFTDQETAKVLKAGIIKQSAKLPDLVQQELEKTQKISEQLGIDWSKAEFVSSEPQEIKFELRGQFHTFKGIKIVFKVDDTNYAIESGSGFRMNSEWRFATPWKEIVKIE